MTRQSGLAFIEAFTIYGIKKESVLDTMTSVLKSKNSKELMNRIQKYPFQAPVEVLASWYQDPNNDNVKRSVEDSKDMIYQHDLLVTAFLFEDECYEYDNQFTLALFSARTSQGEDSAVFLCQTKRQTSCLQTTLVLLRNQMSSTGHTQFL